MYKWFTFISLLVLSLVLVLLEQINFIAARSPLSNFVSVIAYSTLGASVLFITYKFLDWVMPADVDQEIFAKGNVAAALFKGLLLLGVAIIIAAVII